MVTRKMYYRTDKNVFSRGNPKGLVIVKFDESNDSFQLGWSLCNPLDSFMKVEANKIAHDRLLNDPITGSFSDLESVRSTLSKLPHSLRQTAIWLFRTQYKYLLTKIYHSTCVGE